jgi:hypothetical protein
VTKAIASFVTEVQSISQKFRELETSFGLPLANLKLKRRDKGSVFERGHQPLRYRPLVVPTTPDPTITKLNGGG